MKFFKSDASFTEAGKHIHAAREALNNIIEQNTLVKCNFVIAAHWGDSDRLSTYTLYGTDVHFGTMEEAEEILETVKNKIDNEERARNHPQKNDYQIFQLIPVNK
jgi:hypothetical protein